MRVTPVTAASRVSQACTRIDIRTSYGIKFLRLCWVRPGISSPQCPLFDGRGREWYFIQYGHPDTGSYSSRICSANEFISFFIFSGSPWAFHPLICLIASWAIHTFVIQMSWAQVHDVIIVISLFSLAGWQLHLVLPSSSEEEVIRISISPFP